MANDRDTTPTEYHAFDRPENRASWAGAWDDAVETLDTNLKLRGELAERPATAPDGVEFEVVDEGSEHHGKVYQFDDTSGEWALADRQFGSVSTASVDSGQYLQDGEPFESGLQSGEDFDGQGDSRFTNLAEVSTEELQNKTGGAALQSRWEGLVVPITDGAGMLDAIDPSTTDTPIQDAVDVIESSSWGRGKILVPPGVTEESGKVTTNSHIVIEGASMIGSLIWFQTEGDGNNGILFESTEGALHDEFGGLRDVWVRSTGKDSTSDPIVEFGDYRGGRLENVWLERGGSQGLLVNGGYEHSFENVGIWQTGGVGWEVLDAGPGNEVSHLFAGSTVGAVNIENGNWNIGTLNLGPMEPGPGNAVVRVDLGNSRGAIIDYINIEPEGRFYSNGGEALVLNRGLGRNWYKTIRYLDSSGEADYLFRVEQDDAGNNGRWILGPCYDTGGTINQNRIDIADAPTHTSWYFGDSSDIDNSAGSSTGSVRSLADAGTGNG